MDYEVTMSYGIVFLVLLAIIFFIMFWKLRQNRKFVADKIKCWFWPETGNKYYRFIQKEDNGIEVKAPMGHSCPRYFFNRNATGWEQYPDSPPFGMKFLQIDVPAVIWAENNPEPLTPYKEAPIATSRMIDALIDEDFLAYAAENEREKAELEKELLKSRTARMNPALVYGLLVAVMIATIAGAVMTYIGNDALRLILGQMGL